MRLRPASFVFCVKVLSVGVKWGVSFGVDKVSLDDGLGRCETPMF